MIFIFNMAYGQKTEWDSLYRKAVQTELNDGFEKSEKQYQYILSKYPDHYDTHSAIISYYETYFTAVPILALLWENMIDYKSDYALENINKINFLLHRYLEVKRKGTTVHVPPKFVKDWDLDYENNMSPVDAGFLVFGAVDFAKEYKNKNSADRMIVKIDKLFSGIDKFRSKYHGIYWDLYIDFISELHKTEHFKTAMYLITYRTGEKEIQFWVENHSEDIKSFYKWKQSFIGKFIETQANSLSTKK